MWTQSPEEPHKAGVPGLRTRVDKRYTTFLAEKNRRGVDGNTGVHMDTSAGGEAKALIT